jgi:hypothetical protein
MKRLFLILETLKSFVGFSILATAILTSLALFLSLITHVFRI